MVVVTLEGMMVKVEMADQCKSTRYWYECTKRALAIHLLCWAANRACYYLCVKLSECEMLLVGNDARRWLPRGRRVLWHA